jgi:DNA-binding transcriptional ArsR family regulator
MADLLQVVAEPRRREILRLIWDEERSAGEIAAEFGVTFSAVSQHLATLRTAGAVRVRREGRHRIYRARREALGPIAPLLEETWRQGLARLRGLAEKEARQRHTRKARKQR